MKYHYRAGIKDRADIEYWSQFQIEALSSLALSSAPRRKKSTPDACTDGIAGHEYFFRLLQSQTYPEALIPMMLGLPETERDQCQVQILADVLNTADVWLHFLLPEETVRACHLQPVRDIAIFLREMRTTTPKCRIAVLPEGLETIPYIKRWLAKEVAIP